MASNKAPNPNERVIINIAAGNDGEPSRVFVSNGDHPFQIQRGKDVAVPRSVLAALDCAVQGVPERDEHNPDVVNFIERRRFPYTIVGVVPA